MDALIQTGKFHDVEPQDWLADVLVRIANNKRTRFVELLPWNWRLVARRKAA